MKKYFFLFFFCATAMLLPAQKTMYVWQGNGYTEFAVADVDSVTFADALPDTPDPVPEGALSGLFSVSPTKQVRFSQGNLQYTRSTDTWSFAAEQYEAIGEANVANGALADKIDLFGWSGSTGAAKWGISISDDYNDYSSDFKDWGQNAISNGGNQPNLWRTLTYDGWYYLRYTRANADNLIGVARINLNADGSEYANGLILLPDSWTAPAGISFKSGFPRSNSIQAYADYQTFTLEEWSKLEKSGAVFLPASGYRSGTDMNHVGNYGYYCSATPRDVRRAHYLNFHSSGASMGGGYRSCGRAVRLVRDVPGENNNGGDKSEDVVTEKPDGILPGLFTVNAEGKQIQFSMGNLQYTQSTHTWSFAAQQYKFIGTDNVEGGNVTHDANYGDSKSGTALADKIDLFGWSGSTGFAWGISTSTDDIDYSGDFVDWGQNAISNGGNKADWWRTLTHDEWYYLLNTRANASSLQGVARINLNADGSEYANGLILLPDSWTAPASVTFKSGCASGWDVQAYADYQIFTFDQWSKLEKAGAVFLPASGGRNDTRVGVVGDVGHYWSATPLSENDAWRLYLRFYEVHIYSTGRDGGLAVRLVRDVK